jgi:uroporphyrinogen-III decarboxylase
MDRLIESAARKFGERDNDMPEVISINITSEELRQRGDRLARAARFEPVDRVPVIHCLVVRYWLPKIGGTFREYFDDPEAMARYQILGQKWLLENVKNDMGFGPIYVDTQNAQEASALGCETEIGESGNIWVHEGWVQTETDLKKLAQIDPLTTGLYAQAREYHERMQALAARYVVRLKDGIELRPLEQPTITAATMGPFTLAAQVAGATEICLALYDRPDFARELLAIVTEKIIVMMKFAQRLQGMDALWVADDYAANLSLGQFREFVSPCLQRIRQRFPHSRFIFHMCGKADHLLPTLANDLRIDEFSLFGYQSDKRLVQEIMGGRVLLVGNINPMNIAAGTPESVMQESLEALNVFGRGSGGFILSDGANIAPDSPVENINAMWHAACQFNSTGQNESGINPAEIRDTAA